MTNPYREAPPPHPAPSIWHRMRVAWLSFWFGCNARCNCAEILIEVERNGAPKEPSR